MEKTKYDKLVRDLIGNIISANGDIPHTRVLDDHEFASALKKKIIEEAQELCEAETPEEMMAELADILELIEAFEQHHQLDHARVEQIKNDKRLKRGGFSKRIFLEYTEKPESTTK